MWPSALPVTVHLGSTESALATGVQAKVLETGEEALPNGSHTQTEAQEQVQETGAQALPPNGDHTKELVQETGEHELDPRDLGIHSAANQMATIPSYFLVKLGPSPRFLWALAKQQDMYQLHRRGPQRSPGNLL